MHIKRVAIENVKSFRTRQVIDFEEGLNILIGPNGGGKSNLLDIVRIVLRRFFLNSYSESPADAFGQVLDLSVHSLFHPVEPHLDKFRGAEDYPQTVEIDFTVTRADLENIEAVRTYKAQFEQQWQRYRNKPGFPPVDSWDPDLLQEGKVLTYRIVDRNLQLPAPNSAESVFLSYLNHIEMFLLLARHLQQVELRPCEHYYSPYRAGGPGDTHASLAQENYYQLLVSHQASTSRSTVTPLKLATLVFAQRRRKYEAMAYNEGYGSVWESDPDVHAVSQFLGRIGYDWHIEVRNHERNVYESVILSAGRELAMSEASSGEKELLNFVLGMFGLKVKGCVVLIEEPELHLHPRWQKALLRLFVDISKETGNQFILSTHSPVFVTPDTIGNVRRIYRDKEHGSQVIALSPTDIPEQRDLFHMLTSHNNERTLFADMVILVEGLKDRLVIEALIRHCTGGSEGPNTVEVVEVHGKHNFVKYRDLLARLGVKTYIVADLDYLEQVGDPSVNGLFSTDWDAIDKDVLLNENSLDRRTLAKAIEQFLQTSNKEGLRQIWEYIKSRHRRLRPDLSSSEIEKLRQELANRRGEGVLILERGEIEDYLPDGFKSLDEVINLVKPENLHVWTDHPEAGQYFNELREMLLPLIRA